MAAALCGLFVVLYTDNTLVEKIVSRKVSPDFYLKNEFSSYLLDFKDHLNKILEFSSILKQLEREKVGTWLMSFENGQKKFTCPYLETYERLRVLFLVETGEVGIRTRNSVDFFGSRVIARERTDYGNFSLDYTPSYSLIMESDYNKLLEDGYVFNKVYNLYGLSLGRFVSDVFSGSGPVIVLRQGTALPQSFFDIAERYALVFLPFRYFLKKA